MGGARICGSPACLKRLASLCCSPKSSDRTVKNAYGCGAVIQYKVRAVPGRPECGGVARAVDRLPAPRKLHPPPTQPGTARTLYCITARVHSNTLTHTLCCIASPPQFPNWTKLAAYQACEHALAKYIAQLQPYKISLPSGVLRDFKC